MPNALRYAQIAYHWKVARSTNLPYVPQDISIEVTNTCNFKCSFCPQSDPEHFQRVPRTSLTPENCATLMERLREGGVTTDVIHWTLDGEPFSHRQFAELCATGHRFGFTQAIFSTNGALATIDRLRELPTGPGISYTLCIDLTAEERSFEGMRGTPGSWKRVVENVRAALEAEDLGHIAIRVTDISSFEQSLKARTPQDAATELDRLRSLFPASARLAFRTRTLHNATGFVQIGGKPAQPAGYNVCPYPWTSLVIASNGDVVTCCRDLDHKTVLGNLLRQSLAEIWNGEPARAIRTALLNKEPHKIAACQGCDLPWDGAKFSVSYLVSTAWHRLGFQGRTRPAPGLAQR